MKLGLALSVSLSLSGHVQPQAPPPPSWSTGLHGVVYFAPGRAHRLPPPAIDPIGQLAPTIPDSAYVVVAGKTDTQGDAASNLALSLRRARSVADELVARGVDSRQITLLACGERDLNRPTPDDTPELLNRSAYFDWRSTPWPQSLNCEQHPYSEASD